MKNSVILLSALSLSASLSACTAHIGSADIGSALRSSGFLQSGQPYQRVSDQSAPERASPEDCAIHATQRAADTAQAKVRQYKNQIEVAKAYLQNSRAWQSGTCVKPPVRDLPEKPPVLSDDTILFQAVGSCVDLTSRRVGANVLQQALYSVRRDSYWKVAELWRGGHKEQCAYVVTSQINDWTARVTGNLFGQEAYWSAIQDNIDACVAQVTQNCTAPLRNWQSTVESIRSEPENDLRLCQESVEKIAEAKRQIPNMEMTEKLNREEHNKLAASGRRAVPPSACPY